jgi:hypothetical protein
MTHLLYTLSGFAIYFVAITVHGATVGVDVWRKP